MIIVIEGTDQAGKYTQTRLLAERLGKHHKTTVFDFPDYTTPIGREIREYLDNRRNFPPQVIHCLLSANRWEKLKEIETSVNNDHIVIMNRYYQSNIAYGLANDLDQAWLENLDAGLPQPDVVFFLDISPNESFERQHRSRDKFEADADFLSKVAVHYKRLAESYNWKIINATQPKEEIHKLILKELKNTELADYI